MSCRSPSAGPILQGSRRQAHYLHYHTISRASQENPERIQLPFFRFKKRPELNETVEMPQMGVTSKNPPKIRTESLINP